MLDVHTGAEVPHQEYQFNSGIYPLTDVRAYMQALQDNGDIFDDNSFLVSFQGAKKGLDELPDETITGEQLLKYMSEMEKNRFDKWLKNKTDSVN